MILLAVTLFSPPLLSAVEPKPKDLPRYKHPIEGAVYLDKNGNGIRDKRERGVAGIAVSDGLDVVFTDKSGAYRLPNVGTNAIFVFIHQPGDIKQSGQKFFHRLRYDANAAARFDFAVQTAPGATSHGGVRFVQLTDSHVRNVSDRDYMKQATSEIYGMKPPPDFVVATGDLVDWGVDEHFQNYVAGMQQPPVPYFNVFGNHEIARGPMERYHHYIGPDYYSFEQAGILFLSLNCITPSPRQDTWLTNTLEKLGKGQPVVVFQHVPPSLKDMERFAGMKVKSVFSGHWHSEKEMEHANVQSINSPTFIMGGIDASPAGFKIVRMKSDGSAETEWRYGFQNKRLTIVSPQQGAPVSSSYFPIVVNAYDTTRDVRSITWRLGNKPSVSGKLERDSALTWSGKHDRASFPDGTHSLQVEVKDSHGETWNVTQEVQTGGNSPAAPAVQGNWPMFMGNAGHTGFTSNTIDPRTLRLAWSTDTGGDPDFASPILADGRLFLALKKRTGNRTNGVAAFDSTTGSQLWLRETPTAVNHTPAYAGGILCVAEMGGRVYGLDAATGQQKWQHDIIDARGRYSYCAPAADDGYFYAGVMRRLAKLRSTDGRVEWEKQIGGSDNDWISSYGSPAVSGEFVIMAGLFTRGDSIVAVRTDDGSKAWSHPADDGMLASPTIVGERVLFCTRKSTVHCQRLSDGGPIWSRGINGKDTEENSWSATTPAVKLTGKDAGIVVAGSGNGHMSGVDLADGKILWTHVSDPTVFKVSPYRRGDRPLLSSPTIAQDKVFFGSADGHLYCLDLTSGKTLWSFHIGAPVMSTPLVTGNAVFVAAYDGRLYAFTAE